MPTIREGGRVLVLLDGSELAVSHVFPPLYDERCNQNERRDGMTWRDWIGALCHGDYRHGEIQICGNARLTLGGIEVAVPYPSHYLVSIFLSYLSIQNVVI